MQLAKITSIRQQQRRRLMECCPCLAHYLVRSAPARAWSYLHDLLILLPGWPRARALELAPEYWMQTLESGEPVGDSQGNVQRRDPRSAGTRAAMNWSPVQTSARR